MDRRIKTIDLFSGIGGFALGLQNAGYELEEHYFSETDKHAIANYKYNFPNAKHIGNAKSVRGEDFEGIDIITAGFPCQPFSIAGKRRGFEDARGTLFFEIARICSVAKPKSLVLENVKGLLNHDGGRTISIIYQTLTDIGYTVEFQVVNTKWFLPQNRERIYIVGHLATNGGGFKPIFPVGENDELFRGSQESKQTGLQTKYCTTLKANGNMNADDTFIEIPKVAGCLTGGGHSGGLHSDMTAIKAGIRRLTEIECERLQGFPDDWTKYGCINGCVKAISKKQRYKLIGNAVTVRVVEEIGKRLIKRYEQHI